MLDVVLGGDRARPLELLCLGAHADDIEIGSGGTILRLLAERPGSRVRWVVLSATEERRREASASAAAFLGDAEESGVIVEDFQESYFPYLATLKDYLKELRGAVDPDLVLCPHRHDDHQDHRTVAELVWQTFRDHVIAEYEIPKYEGDLGRPNSFVRLSPETVGRKLALLQEHFPSQHGKYWFRPELFSGIMAIRGVEAGVAWAEGFHVRKFVM
jgi:LmbE family N-acetylglucosaminyl deacetylase